MDTGRTHRQLLFEETRLDESFGSRASLISEKKSSQTKDGSQMSLLSENKSPQINKRRICSDPTAEVELEERLYRATSLAPMEYQR